jgi:hypothetical protein
MEAIYKLDGRIAETRQWAGGPWSPDQQHGSAPASLVAHVAEKIPTAQPMRVARITLDLLRPVPVAPLEISTEVLREGRKIQVCTVDLSANGTEVARATVLKVRALDVDLPPAAAVPQQPLPPRNPATTQTRRRTAPAPSSPASRCKR